MQLPRFFFYVICTAAICLTNVNRAEAARYVRAQIILDGKVLLEGNASDNGHRDADQLWDALKDVKFKPTAAFKKLQEKEDAKEVLLKSTTGRGELVNLQIILDFGGRAVTNELHIHRVPADAPGREWQLDADEVANLFDSRMISRYEAGKLRDPKREK